VATEPWMFVMSNYLIHRFLYMLVLLWVMSIATFVIIQLPPGDYVNTYIQRAQLDGKNTAPAEIAKLRRQFGLDKPVHVRYFKWAGGMLKGDFGYSLEWDRPVVELIKDRLFLTILLNILTMIFVYVAAMGIGIYSATHQYSIADYCLTVLGFIGIATPGFLLALIVMVLVRKTLGISVGGLFSPEYAAASWSMARAIDMGKHMIVPIVINGMAGTAGLIRVMRGSLLDELKKPYVETARAKGLSEKTLLFRYPVRVAINPVVSNLGMILPAVVSGGIVVEIVLGLPTVGPLLLSSLLSQDMYLGGAIVMLLGVLTIVGMFVSDMLLVWVDPRIRMERQV